MSPPRRTVCGARLHDFTDPANVGLRRARGGTVKRYCIPCEDLRRRRISGAMPRQPRPAQPGERELQALAHGLNTAETAERDHFTRRSVHRHLAAARTRMGAANDAAAVALGLACGIIRCDARGPLPGPGPATARHVASLLALIRGRRAPAGPHSQQMQRMLDDLYAFSEPHAVSVAWAADLITGRDIRKKAA